MPFFACICACACSFNILLHRQNDLASWGHAPLPFPSLNPPMLLNHVTHSVLSQFGRISQKNPVTCRMCPFNYRRRICSNLKSATSARLCNCRGAKCVTHNSSASLHGNRMSSTPERLGERKRERESIRCLLMEFSRHDLDRLETQFLANVNSRSCLLYAIVRPSVVQ